MPVFTIQSPDGRKIKIEAGDQATAVRGAQEWVKANPAQINMSVTDAFARKAKVPPAPAERPNLLNSTGATINGLVSAVPGLQTASDALMGAGGMLLGKDYNETVQGLQDTRERFAQAAPLARMAGEIAPVVAGSTALPAMSNTLLRSAASMAGYEGLKSIGEGDQAPETLAKMGMGGAGGAAGYLAGKAVEKVGSGIAKTVTSRAQNAATSKAVANAPDAEDLASAASQLFKSSKASGVGVKPNVFGTFAQKTAAAAKAADIDQELDTGAWAVYNRMIEYARQGFDDLSSLSLSRLHNLRQMAQDVVLEAKKNRTKNFAQQLIDGLDDMIAGLKPSELYIPPGRLANGTNSGTNAGNALLEGISTWSKAKKVGIIEQAIAKAQNYSSGVESGLVNQFRTILNNKNTAKLFTEQERKAMQAVVQGTAPVKFLRTLGIFKGLGGAALGGFGGGPWGAAAGWAAGAGGKTITEAATMRAAQRAGMIAATPNIPVVPMAPNLLAPAARPVEIMVRGGTPLLTSDR